MYEIFLAFALLLSNVHGTAPIPPGWEVVASSRNEIPGFDAIAYRNPANQVVVAIDGLQTVQDVVASFQRRREGYDPRIVAWIASVDADFVTGFSGGGGIASWVGFVLDIQTVTFNSGRTEQSLLNSDTNQYNVIIRGDRWGDPWNGFYGNPLPGEYVILDRPARLNTHKISTLIRALNDYITNLREDTGTPF